MALFETPCKPNIEGLISNLKREGTPDRVYHMELFLDQEIHEAVRERFNTAPDLKDDDPFFTLKRVMANHQFLGLDCFIMHAGDVAFPRERLESEDTVEGDTSRGTRNWTDENIGVISTWEDFEAYSWPEPKKADTTELEWLEKNLPEGMGAAGCSHSVCEQVTWLFGYSNLCYKLYDDPDLVDAMFERIGSIFVECTELLLQFDCVKLFFGGDDMGFKTGTMLPPDVLIGKCLPWHRKITELIHENGLVNVLHACGNLRDIMDAIIDDVKYDAKHSFEDTIQTVTDAMKEYGERISLIGGIDVDFLCRSSEEEIRARVRDTLDECIPGGGYCLGSGNSVANYIPLDNYLAMVDEGRNYSG